MSDSNDAWDQLPSDSNPDIKEPDYRVGGRYFMTNQTSGVFADGTYWEWEVDEVKDSGYHTQDYEISFTISDPLPELHEICKFNESELIDEIREYIKNTYDAHYGNSKYQAFDMILDKGHGMGFALGNVIKYASRYGKKDGRSRADLLKTIHYAILALHVHDIESDGDNDENETEQGTY